MINESEVISGTWVFTRPSINLKAITPKKKKNWFKWKEEDTFSLLALKEWVERGSTKPKMSLTKRKDVNFVLIMLNKSI